MDSFIHFTLFDLTPSSLNEFVANLFIVWKHFLYSSELELTLLHPEFPTLTRWLNPASHFLEDVLECLCTRRSRTFTRLWSIHIAIIRQRWGRYNFSLAFYKYNFLLYLASKGITSDKDNGWHKWSSSRRMLALPSTPWVLIFPALPSFNILLNQHYPIFRGLNKDVKMVVYNQMPHGFLNYDAPSGMKEAKICVRDASDFLKELLSSSWFIYSALTSSLMNENNNNWFIT